MRNQKSSGAFTLIEMLVVIAVIMALAAVLYPAFSRAREKGREARCASNLRQLYVAAMNYAAEHDNHLPLPISQEYQWVGDGKWYHHRGWVDWWRYVDGSANPSLKEYYWWGAEGRACITNGVLWSYVSGTLNVYLCPTFALRNICGRDDAVRGYSMNHALYAGWPGYNMYGVTNAAGIIFLADEKLSGAAVASADSEFLATNDAGIVAAKYHSGQGHRVYLDGHLEKE